MGTVRKLQNRDIQPLAEVFPSVGQDHLEGLYLEHLQQECVVLVALLTHKEGRRDYVGFATVRLQSADTYFWRHHIAEITDLYAISVDWEQEIMQALIDACEASIQDEGYQKAGLCLGADAGKSVAAFITQHMGYQQLSEPATHFVKHLR